MFQNDCTFQTLLHFNVKTERTQFLRTDKTFAQGTFLAINQAGLIDNPFKSDNEVCINLRPAISTKVIQLILSKNK